MKKLLLLGGDTTLIPVIAAAHKRGYYVLTCDYLPDNIAHNFGRRYFYPLIGEFSTYRGLESANPKNLPNAHKMADSVLCLPMHHELSDNDIEHILNIIKK